MALVPRNVTHGDVPYQKRWELLRPIIIELYVEQALSVSEVAGVMKAEHGFAANENQYKYQFRKWKVKRNLNQSLKRKMLDKAEERAGAGKRTLYTLGNRPVDARRLLREIKQDGKIDMTLTPSTGGQVGIRRILPGFGLQLGPSIFMAWNKPYGAMNPGNIQGHDHASPFGLAASTPSDVGVTTPGSNNAASPANAPSPLSAALIMRKSLERTKIFAEGRFDDLLKSMDKKEAVLMSSWLYQFWFFAFKSAKHWGSGPRYWDADLLGFDAFLNQSTPRPDIEHADHRLAATQSPRSLYQAPEAPSAAVIQPSQLCHWSIHYECEVKYEEIPEPISQPNGILGDDPTNWRPWPPAWRDVPFQEQLVSGLATNDFSKINPDALPVAVPQIARAASRTPDVLLRESLGFAIMGRNLELIDQLCEQIDKHPIDLSDLYPLHLAIDFLDGATTCCNVLAVLTSWSFGLPTVRDRRNLFVNDLGHTLLDNLMISILKSHTSTAPVVVDERFKDQSQFIGQEVDVCGRWDADSESFRALLRRGQEHVPMSWRHKFCHTSSQTICHCLRQMKWTEIYCSEMHLPSGIYLKYCSECGLKLPLTPLHTMVVTAFHLANDGCEDEDLFGMLACVLTGLSCELNPIGRAEISAGLLFGVQSSLTSLSCTHQKLTPAELADQVPQKSIESWSNQTRKGWELIRLVLWKGQKSAEELNARCDEDEDSDLESEAFCDMHEASVIFGGHSQLNNLFASVQAELVTYRRIHEGDPWVSENMNLSSLVRDLSEGDSGQLSIGMFQKSLLKPICSCGEFEAQRHVVVSADAACKQYISNMDDWSRTTFIPFINPEW